VSAQKASNSINALHPYATSSPVGIDRWLRMAIKGRAFYNDLESSRTKRTQAGSTFDRCSSLIRNRKYRN
jgi:hypothetical protein